MIGVWLALAGLAVGVIVFLATGGHVLFLPLVLVLPLIGFWGTRRRRGHSRASENRWPPAHELGVSR